MNAYFALVNGKRCDNAVKSYTLFQNGAHSEKSWGEQRDNEATRANSVSSDVYCMLDDCHVSKLLSSSMYGRV